MERLALSPPTSPPYFPLGSQETEVKVAAGALGAGQPESRWDEHHIMPMLLTLGLGCLPLEQADCWLDQGKDFPWKLEGAR